MKKGKLRIDCMEHGIYFNNWANFFRNILFVDCLNRLYI